MSTLGVGDALRRALERAVGRDTVSRADGGEPARWDDAELGWRLEARDCCATCARDDGRTFPSLTELERVMPLAGPHPACERGGGCTCRAVPA